MTIKEQIEAFNKENTPFYIVNLDNIITLAYALRSAFSKATLQTTVKRPSMPMPEKSVNRRGISRASVHTAADTNGMQLSKKPSRTIPTLDKFTLTAKQAVSSVIARTCLS